jgi:hypothetical protein
MTTYLFPFPLIERVKLDWNLVTIAIHKEVIYTI